MTTLDDIETPQPQPVFELRSFVRSSLIGSVKLTVMFVMQSLLVILIGFAALFLSFEPAWSAQGPYPSAPKPGNARSGSLLLKTEDGYAYVVRPVRAPLALQRYV